jgi:hypothetical protein
VLISPKRELSSKIKDLLLLRAVLLCGESCSRGTVDEVGEGCLESFGVELTLAGWCLRLAGSV